MKQKSLVILFALCVMLFSCQEDKRPYLDSQSQTVAQSNTAEKGKTDTLTKDTKKTVVKDTVKVEAVNSTKAVTQEGELPTFWEVLALGISGLTFVLCLVVWHRISRLGKDVSYELKEVEQNSNSRHHSFNNTIAEKFDAIGKTCSMLRGDMNLLSERIRSLESNGMPTKDVNHEREKKTEGPKDDKERPTKRGYFGIVKVGRGIAMFNDYPKSRNDGAYFEVEYLNDNQCEFAPIELDRIRSIDAVNEAVEYNGDIAYAKSMEVIKKGKAVFDKGHGFWKITDKADIKLKN